MSEIGALLTTGQLRDLLQVDRITIYRMLKDGRLQGFKVGGQWRFSRESIEAWLQDQKAGCEPVEPFEAETRPDFVAGALPLGCVRAIQDLLADVLDVAVLTTTRDGTPITEVSNSCAFCDLVLSTPVGRARCAACWEATAQQSTAKPRPSLCHAGLRYTSGRIEVEGQYVAAVHVGQFLERSSSADGDWAERLDRLAAETRIDRAELQAALESVHQLEADRLRMIPRTIQRLAHTFSEIGEERLALLGRLKRIAEMTQL